MVDFNTLKKIEGTHTIETIMDKLNVNRQRAIFVIYKLRNKNFVKTKRLSNNKRVYKISTDNRLKGITYEDLINKYSPIKLSKPKSEKIYNDNIQLEDALIYAITSKNFRTILASLSLFKNIKDWSRLYQLAKKKELIIEVAVLYDLARTLFLVRKMPKHFFNNAMKKNNKNRNWKYFIKNLSSDEFNNLSKKWKVHIPFNKADLEVYKK